MCVCVYVYVFRYKYKWIDRCTYTYIDRYRSIHLYYMYGWINRGRGSRSAGGDKRGEGGEEGTASRRSFCFSLMAVAAGSNTYIYTCYI